MNLGPSLERSKSTYPNNVVRFVIQVHENKNLSKDHLIYPFMPCNSPPPWRINFMLANINLLFPGIIPVKFGSIWLSSFIED